MLKKCVSVIFDRKNEVCGSGKGKVEIRVYLDRNVRKYILVGKTTKSGWKTYQKSKDLQLEVAKYQRIVDGMMALGEEMTMENFNFHLNQQKPVHEVKDPLNENFIDYIKRELAKEELREGTYRHKIHVIETLECYGKLKTIADLTPTNIKAFDHWLHDTGDRTDVTVWDYHKRVRKYTRKLWMDEIIPEDPYKLCKFSRGHSKPRTPLTENELLKLRQVELNPKLDRVRDLFIFAAYTGLAYVDVESFDFKTMTQQIGDMYYIDGKRTKTGTEFYTPILKPAMDVLKKYNFRLPQITNQKANEYLHVIEAILGFTKSLTFHLARHSFATLALAHDVPIENVARMLGHTDIKTTQIYAKILKSTVERHGSNLNNMIL